MKRLLILFILFLILASTYFLISDHSSKEIFPSTKQKTSDNKETSTISRSFSLQLKKKANTIKQFAIENGYSTKYSFLINMGLPSGKNRFFIYDLRKDSVVHSGLVAHGSCRSGFLDDPIFSNVPECGCSSVGKYRVGYLYEGQFGKAFKLHGLDSSNSNAFKRTIVLHAYDCVPNEETYPKPICNSLGCPMVSYRFLDATTAIIENSKKPILLLIYN